MEWLGVSFEQAWISSTLPDSICQMKRALFVGQFVRWAFESNACPHISEGLLSFNTITFIGCVIIWAYAPKQAWDVPLELSPLDSHRASKVEPKDSLIQ